MQQTGKRKRRYGDRYDGRRLRSLDPLFGIVPYVMKKKSGASNLFGGTLDVTEVEKYIRAKRTEDLPNLGMLHFFIAAYVRMISQRPALNRFVSGQKIFARYGIQVNISVKKELTLAAQESTVKVFLEPEDTISDVYRKVQAVIDEAKAQGDSNNTDKAARMFNYVPGLLLKNVIWVIEVLDYFGKMPKWINKVSPFHGSLFISDLGSIGLPPVYHHLYDFGNIPIFLCFGPKSKRKTIGRDGTIVEKKLMDYTMVMDERICDGFYFSGLLRMLNELFKNPAQLENPPAKVVEDID